VITRGAEDLQSCGEELRTPLVAGEASHGLIVL